MESNSDTFHIGRFIAHLIQDGLFQIPAETLIRLGRQVAIAPKSARLLLGLTCLVVRDDSNIVLIDTGLGQKPLGDLVVEYSISLPRQLMPALNAVGIQPQDVDTVILSHLHWDHAGGSTRPDGRGKLVPAFPNATYVLQKLEWEWARSQEGQTTGSYRPQDFLPLHEARQLRLVDGNLEVLPGIQVELTGGHCPGHQVVWIEDDGDSALYPADIIPTPQLLKSDQVMSYDHTPSRLVAAKQDLIQRAIDFGANIVFQHASNKRLGKLFRDSKGKIVVERK
jgi:glyoxylase-like metal-dependent hydrolase (beta-lactamase superfamily II)